MPDDIPSTEVIVDLPAPGPRVSGFQAGAPVSAIVPRTLGELAMVASAIIRAGLAPDSYVSKDGTDEERADKTKSRIMIGIMKGAEVGLPPITALSTIAIISNRPCIWGDGAMALVQSRGAIERFEEYFEGGTERAGGSAEDEAGNQDYSPTLRDFPDDFTAVCRIWRKGQDNPYEGRFSVRDAKRAHLWGNTKKVPWIEHPKRMLKMRARAFPLRDGFADCLMGLSIGEEMQDISIDQPKTDTSFLDDASVPPQAALPAPSEEPIMTQAIIDMNAEPVIVQASADKKPSRAEGEGAIVADRTPLPADLVPTIEIVKPHGGKAQWVETRKQLVDAFCKLATIPQCDAFRTTNSATVTALRGGDRGEHGIYEEVSAAHELALREKGQANG